jgi:hypothetical protein
MIALEYLSRTILLCRDYVPDSISDEEICHCFQSLQILCVSDARNLSSHAGQASIVTLVSLLSRMGMQVRLALPDTALLFPQPPLAGASVSEALVGSSGKLIPGAAVTQDDKCHPDLIFALGDSKVENGTVPCWHLTGGDWGGTLALEGQAESHCFSGEWPIGPMVSAALAAGEAFKFGLRRLPLRNPAAKVFFEMSASCSCQFDGVSIPKGGVDLGNVDIISAGAISQATLYVLTRLPRARISGRIFDNDVTGPSNLNRNMLTLVEDVGLQKVVIAAQRCNREMRIEGIPERFPGRSSEARKLAPRVVVGVDDIPSRWEVQRRAAGWVTVGGTSHFSISSSSHGPDEPCCGCLHPTNEPDGPSVVPIPTVSFVSFLAGLVTAVRLIRESLGIPCPPNRQQLWLTPLRMDLPWAAMWMPVAPSKNCPVKCASARTVVSS